MAANTDKDALKFDHSIQAKGEENDRLCDQKDDTGDVIEEPNHYMESNMDVSPIDTDKNKHWLWDNWILLAGVSMLCFCICNVFIGSLADMGYQAITYYCSGSLILSICQFIYKREWSRKNVMLRQADQKKVLFRNW